MKMSYKTKFDFKLGDGVSLIPADEQDLSRYR